MHKNSFGTSLVHPGKCYGNLRKFCREKRRFRFECGSTSKEQIMNNEKIPHANWKSIERKSETFIPMALDRVK